MRPRLPVEGVLFEDRYPSDARVLESIAEHDRAMGDFDREQGRPGRNWSGGIVRKFAKAVRGELGEYYRSKGAVL